jgi:hypothetical protein
MKRAKERPRGDEPEAAVDDQNGRSNSTPPTHALVGPVEPHTGRAVPIRDRLLWSLDDVAALMGVSRRLLECQRAAGKMPQCDVRIGRRALWRPATIASWLDSQAAGRGGRS